ncbi:MAG: putative DNA binding domain-containing protein, partial [Campylobacterota bacterium]|nr:putative DNA binding domain-containing protein [Campylobacterota bacterium]
EKEISAFLNSKNGGVLYIGINNDGKVLGVDDCDELQLKIKDKLKFNIEPSCLGLFEVVVEQRENKNIVKVVIASGRERPYYIKKYGMSSKGCFIRIGSSSEPMNSTMIEDLFAKRVRNSLSKIKSQRQDLTFEQLKIYYEAKGLKLNEKFASNLELLTEDGYFNYVAYLMADENGTSIKVAKYAGTDKVDLIENNEYGYCSLIKATKKVLEKLEIENKTAALITSTTRKEQPLWDRVALREAVINAMVHNDYTTQNPPVFEIFSDRIEITSTGGLSTIKNLDDFFSGYSKPISRELMRIYKDLEMVEHLGSGLNRILKAYGKESFVVKENYMRNIFYSNTKKLQTTQETIQETIQETTQEVVKKVSTRDKIVELIGENSRITRDELASIVGVSANAIKQHLANLKKDGVLQRVGSTKSGYWEIV